MMMNYVLTVILALSAASILWTDQSHAEESGNQIVPKITVKLLNCDYEKKITREISPDINSSVPLCKPVPFKGKLITKYTNKKTHNLDFNSHELYVPMRNAKDSELVSIEVQDQNGVAIGLEAFTDGMVKYFSSGSVEVAFDSRGITNPLVQMLDSSTMMGGSIVYSPHLTVEDMKEINSIFKAADKVDPSHFGRWYVSYLLKEMMKILVLKEDHSLSSKEVEYFISLLNSIDSYEYKKLDTKVRAALAEKVKLTKLTDYGILKKFSAEVVKKVMPSLLDEIVLAQMPVSSFEEIKKLSDDLHASNLQEVGAQLLLQLLEKQFVANKLNPSLPGILAAVAEYQFNTFEERIGWHSNSVASNLLQFFIEKKVIKSLSELGDTVDKAREMIDSLYTEEREKRSIWWIQTYLDTKSEIFSALMTEDMKKDPELKNVDNFYYKIFSKFFQPSSSSNSNDMFFWEPSYQENNTAIFNQFSFFQVYLRLRGVGLVQADFESLSKKKFFCDKPEVLKVAMEHYEGDPSKTLEDFLENEVDQGRACQKYGNPVYHSVKKEIAKIVKEKSSEENYKALVSKVCFPEFGVGPYPATRVYWCNFLRHPETK